MRELSDRQLGEALMRQFCGGVIDHLTEEHNKVVAAGNERRRIRAEEKKAAEEEKER
jgi:hypothetical protein